MLSITMLTQIIQLDAELSPLPDAADSEIASKDYSLDCTVRDPDRIHDLLY